MRNWIPASVIAIAAVLAGMTFGVIRNGDLGGDGEALTVIAVTTLAVGLYGGAIVALPLALLAYVFRRLNLRSEAAGWRTMLDLGGDRSEIVRGESVDGLRRGAIASGVGAVIGLMIPMIVPYYQPADGTLPLPSLWALGGTLIAYLLLVGVTGLVHWAAASAATKPGARPGVATVLEPEAGTSSDGPRLTWRLRALILVVAVSAAVLVADRFLVLRPPSPTTSGEVALEDTFSALVVVVAFGGLVLMAHAIAWATRLLAASLGRLLARASSDRARGLGLASQIAADGLTHRSSLRSLATGAIGGVMAIAALASVSGAVESAHAEIAARYQMRYTVATTAWWDDLDSPVGAVPQEIDATVVDALLADERVVAIPYGVVLGDSWDYENWYEDTLIESGTSRESVLVVDPDDLTALTPDGLRPLGFQDGTATISMEASVWQNGSGNALGAPFTLPNAGSIPFVARDWAESEIGDVPVVGVLLWPATADSPLQEDGSVNVEGPTSDEEAVLDAAVTDAGGNGLERYVLDSWSGYWSYGSGFVGLLTTLAVPLMLLGIVLVVALATASVRDRRREMATLSALGASPLALRIAPAVEAGTTVLAGCLVGLPVGTLVGLALSHPTLFGAGAPLDPANTLWITRWELARTSFAVPLVLGLATLTVSVVAALIAGARTAKGTPVEELRDADKEGIL